MSDNFSSISIQKDDEPQAPKITRPPRKRGSAGKKIISSLLPRNPYLITALILVLLFALYCGIGFLLVPSLLKDRLTKYFQKSSEMGLSVGKTEFNPFTFQMHLVDISLTNESASKKDTAFLKAANLLMTVDPLAFLRDKLVCRSLQADALAVHIIRYNDHKYNVSQLFKTSPSSPSTDFFDFSSLPFLFSLNNISITGSSVVFDDQVTGKTHKIEKIALTLPTLANFSYQVKNYTSPQFSAVVNGSPVQLTGEAAMPGEKGADTTRLSFDLHALDLPLYSGYLPLSLPVQLTKGTADGKIQVAFAQDKDHSRRLTFLFQMATKDIEMQSHDQSLVMTIPTAKIEGDMQPFTGDIHLENILFHEPEIRLKKNFSEQTLDGFLPAAGKSAPHPQSLRADQMLALDLFVMDNGTLHIQESQGKRESEKTYQSLQLSIKDYSNKPRESHESGKEGCTFKLSGEQPAPPASFSWQGEIDSAAHGTVQLSRFPASLLATIFTEEKETSMTGVADMTGNLSIKRNPQGEKIFSYSITNGSIKISDFGVSEKKHEWLHAAAFTIGPLDSKDHTLDVGNIYLQKATVTLDHIPLFLESFLKKGSNYKVHGIDFSGDFICKATENSKTPLVFNNLSLQVNNLEKDPKDKENFAVTGKIGQAGEIKARGTVALGPFRSSLAVEFSGLPSKELFPWYTDAPFLLEGQARLEGVGRLTYPDIGYKGSLRLLDAHFDNKQAKSSLAWSAANFHDFSYTKKPFHVGMGLADIDRPLLTFVQADDKLSIFEQLSSFMQGLLPAKETGKATKAPATPLLQIAEIRIGNGTVSHKDLRLTPPWQQEISAVQGKIQNVHIPSAQTASDYVFSGSIAGRPIAIEGSANLFAGPLMVQSTVKLTAMPVSLFKNQLTPQLNIDSSKGTFDITVRNNWKDGQESGDAQYVFHGLNPTSTSADTALPLALLSDRKDNFELRVPLVDPEEKQHHPVFTDTVKYFKRMLVKSVVAPLLLTDENFSRLAHDDTPDFVDGENILSEKGKAKLTLYKDLLNAHPRLRIELTGLVDTTLDRKVLQEKLTVAEKKRVDEENRRRSQEWQKLQEQKQHKPGQHTTLVEKDIPADELAKYAPVFPKQVLVSDEALHDLADQRSASAYEFFTTTLGIGTDRVIQHSSRHGQQDMEPVNRVRIILQPVSLPHNLNTDGDEFNQ